MFCRLIRSLKKKMSVELAPSASTELLTRLNIADDEDVDVPEGAPPPLLRLWKMGPSTSNDNYTNWREVHLVHDAATNRLLVLKCMTLSKKAVREVEIFAELSRLRSDRRAVAFPLVHEFMTVVRNVTKWVWLLMEFVGEPIKTAGLWLSVFACIRSNADPDLEAAHDIVSRARKASHDSALIKTARTLANKSDRGVGWFGDFCHATLLVPTEPVRPVFLESLQVAQLLCSDVVRRGVLLQLVRDLTTALNVLHFVHGDLHAGNVCLRRSERWEVVFAADVAYFVPPGVRGTLIDMGNARDEANARDDDSVDSDQSQRDAEKLVRGFLEHVASQFGDGDAGCVALKQLATSLTKNHTGLESLWSELVKAGYFAPLAVGGWRTDTLQLPAGFVAAMASDAVDMFHVDGGDNASRACERALRDACQAAADDAFARDWHAVVGEAAAKSPPWRSGERRVQFMGVVRDLATFCVPAAALRDPSGSFAVDSWWAFCSSDRATYGWVVVDAQATARALLARAEPVAVQLFGQNNVVVLPLLGPSWLRRTAPKLFED
jgi:hypothetical protein